MRKLFLGIIVSAVLVVVFGTSVFAAKPQPSTYVNDVPPAGLVFAGHNSHGHK